MFDINVEFILICVLSVIMLFSIIFGIIKGFKKGFYDLVWTILFWIIFWLTADVVCGDAIFRNEGLFSFIRTITGTLLQDYEAKDLISFALEISNKTAGSATGLDFNNVDANILEDFKTSTIALLSVSVRIVYFILLRIVLGIVKAIIYGLFFKSFCKGPKLSDLRALEKRQERYKNKHHGNVDIGLAKEIKRTRHKLENKGNNNKLGFITGVCRGLIVCLIFMLVINSGVNILPKVEKENEINASTEETLQESNTTIYDFILSYTSKNPTLHSIASEAITLIKGYQGSTLNTFTAYEINGQKADELFADLILSGKSKDVSISLREEISTLIQVANEACIATDGFNIDSINWTSLSEKQIKGVQNVLVLLSKDDMVVKITPSLIGLALSLDAIKNMLPEGTTINMSEYGQIKWDEELTTIASLVADVYSLGDLSSLDYFNLDTTIVKKIFTELSTLNSINFLGHLGTSILINNLNKTNPDILNGMEDVASKITSIDFASDIKSLGDIYDCFVEAYNKRIVNEDNCKNDDGTINYLTLATSKDVKDLSPLFDNILETCFVSTLLPEILEIAKSKLSSDIASIINPSVKTVNEWKNEIKSVLEILASLTKDGEKPFTTIEKFDFSVFEGFTSESIVKSNLLSYAVIRLFGQASKGEGLLSSLGSLGSSILVPDYLLELNEETHKFNAKWYGSEENDYKDGDLYIVFDTLTKCISHVKSLDNFIKYLPSMLGEIKAERILNCEVLYYTVASLLSSFSNLFVIPENTLCDSDNTINGQIQHNLIKRDEVNKLLSILTDSNVIDMNKLYVYEDILGKYDASGNLMINPTIEEINEAKARKITNPSQAQIDDKDVIGDISVEADSLKSILTSSSFYDKNETDEEKKFSNVNKLFSSDILRATFSGYVNDMGGEDSVISIPNSSKQLDVRCLKGKDDEGNEIFENIDIITTREFGAFVSAINELDISLDSLSDSPLAIIDSFKNEDNTLKSAVSPMVGNDGYESIYYCGIIHSTISKYVKKYEGGDGSLSLVVPTNTIDIDNSDLLTPLETKDLIQSLAIIGTDLIDNSGSSQVDNVIDSILSNDASLDSFIIKATLTKFIDKGLESKPLSDVCYIEASPTDGKKIISKENLLDFLKALNKLKGDGTFEDLVNDMGTLNVNKLVEANKIDEGDSEGKISHSLLLRNVLTSYMKDSLTIPSDAKENEILYANEVTSLINILDKIITDKEAPINNVGSQVDNFKTGTLYQAKEDIQDSIVINATIATKLTASNALFVPRAAYATNDKDYFTSSEVGKLLDALIVVLGDDCKLTDASSGASSLLNVTDDDAKIYTFSDDDFKALCESIIISCNIRNKLIDATTSYLKVGLTLNEKIDSSVSDFDTLTASIESINNKDNYFYTTINYTDSSSVYQKSDIYDLLTSLKGLRNAGLIKAFTDTSTKEAGDSIDLNMIHSFKQDAFVEIVTDGRILRDSVPQVLENFLNKYKKMFNSEMFDLSLIKFPDCYNSSDEKKYTSDGESVTYWKNTIDETGRNTTIDENTITCHYINGEIYCFLDYIESALDISKNITTLTHEEFAIDLKNMIRSKIGFNSTDMFLTKDSIVAACNLRGLTLLPSRQVSVDSIPTDEHSVRLYQTVKGQNYIDDLAYCYKG